MNEQDTQPTASSSITPEAVLIALFRRRWLILGFTLLGLAAAAGAWFHIQPLYRSQARLMVKYVVENRNVEPDQDGQIRSTDPRGDAIISSELEILTSRDLAEQVAGIVGPELLEKLLGETNGPNAVRQAAGVIAGGLTVGAPRRSTTIHLTFQHRDPEVVVPVLENLVRLYRAKHEQVHRGAGMLDTFWTAQRDQLRADITRIEEDLRRKKEEAETISPAETQRALAAHESQIRQQLREAQLRIAERQVMDAAREATTPDMDVREYSMSDDFISDYRILLSQIDMLRQREAEYQLRLTDEHPGVIGAREHRLELQAKRRELEEEYPGLRNVALAGNDSTGQAAAGMGIHALEARMESLTNQLSQIRAEASRLDRIGSEISDLMRQKEELETRHRFYLSSLERISMNERLGPGSISNITDIQKPSPAGLDTSKRMKVAAGAGAGGLGLGIALALLLELFLNKTIRGRKDVESKLKLSYFLSIPELNLKGRMSAKSQKQTRLLAAKTGDSAGDEPSGEPLEVAPWENEHPLTLHFAALRDRLMANFQMRHLNHKPKLVGVTGCSPKSGVSTLATGLAAALSQTGDGAVLLVDMNVGHGTANPFRWGRPDCALADLLDARGSNAAQVDTNLYMASGSERNGTVRPIGPKAFTELVPDLKASRFDYIIFDMPPVTQTSPTVVLSGMMDKVLFVAEPGKTNAATAKQACELLEQHGADLVGVINRLPDDLPKWLQSELT